MFRNTIKNLSVGVYFYMSWTIMRFWSTGRTNRSKVCKVPRSTIMSIHFNGARSQDGDKCKLLRRCKFDSMRAISLIIPVGQWINSISRDDIPMQLLSYQRLQVRSLEQRELAAIDRQSHLYLDQ